MYHFVNEIVISQTKNWQRNITIWIIVIDRSVATIGKHVIAKHTLSGGCIGVRINESADLRIVISGLEVVELGLSIK